MEIPLHTEIWLKQGEENERERERERNIKKLN